MTITEAEFIRVAIHTGTIFYVFLTIYMIRLRPQTRVEKAMFVKTLAFGLVFLRVLDTYYDSIDIPIPLFGPFAWSMLIVSFLYTFYAIVTTSFGKKGRKDRDTQYPDEGVGNKGYSLA